MPVELPRVEVNPCSGEVWFLKVANSKNLPPAQTRPSLQTHPKPLQTSRMPLPVLFPNSRSTEPACKDHCFWDNLDSPICSGCACDGCCGCCCGGCCCCVRSPSSPNRWD